MRIVSPFSDFYDWVKAHDREDFPFWHRKTQSLFPWQPPVVLTRLERAAIGYSGHVDYRLEFVLFCGRVYPRLTAEARLGSPWPNLESYDLTEIRNWLRQCRLHWYEPHFDLCLDAVRAAEGQGVFTALHVKHQSPILLCGVNNLVVNPKLTEVNFQTQAEATAAWQEIDTFMRLHLTDQPAEPLPVTDETMAAAKGHDHPFSFRRLPGQGRKGKKK